MEGNINDCLADTNCIGMVENVDTRKVVVGVENEGVLNTLKINDIVVLGGSNSDEKLIGILTKVTKKKVEFDETEQTEDLSYSNNCCVVNLVGSFYNKYGAGSENKFKRAINTYPEIMLMCHKVTHKKLIDNSPLFRKNFKVEFHGSHTNCVASFA